jgi:hypothetical protein
VFLGLCAAYLPDSPGSRTFLLVLAFLASAAVISVASVGPYPSSDAFGLGFAQLPRAQASALGVVLTGGAPSPVPMFRGTSSVFLPLALLAAAGALVSLLSVDPTKPPEALGYERVDPNVPEGRFRSLFPEGRARLAEATATELPAGAEAPSLTSLFVAVLAAMAALTLASLDADHLMPLVAGVVIIGLGSTLGLSYASRNVGKVSPRTPSAPLEPGTVAAPSEPL